MKSFGRIIISILVLFNLTIPTFAAPSSDASTPPDNVQAYAENEGFHKAENFISNSLNKDGKALSLGDAHQKYIFLYDEELMKYSSRVSDFLHESGDWIYTLDDNKGHAITFLTIHTEPELGQGGGGDARSFGQAMNLMKTLIHDYGDIEEPIVLTWRRQYFVMYSFGGDERIISLSSPEYLDRSYKNVKSYLDLPTGTQLLLEIEKYMEIDRNTPKGTYSGGTSIDLKAAPKTNESRQIIIALSTITVLSFVILFCYKNKRKKINKKYNR